MISRFWNFFKKPKKKTKNDSREQNREKDEIVENLIFFIIKKSTTYQFRSFVRVLDIITGYEVSKNVTRERKKKRKRNSNMCITQIVRGRTVERREMWTYNR